MAGPVPGLNLRSIQRLFEVSEEFMRVEAVRVEASMLLPWQLTTPFGCWWLW